MTVHRRLNIGLFGFGEVGEGLYKVLHQTSSLNATIKKVCIKDANKKRNAPSELFTTDRDELLNDETINVIVEVINESDAAFQIISTALLQAQQLGFAEANPTLDVDGWDAVHKWVILLCHAYGIVATTDDILFTG